MNHPKNLFNYILRIADSQLILGHRLSEWTGHGPMLEEELASANTALDLIGQATTLYAYAAQVEGKGRTEDDLAYLRGEREFVNHLLSEQPKGDFGFSMLRQMLCDAFDVLFYESLMKSTDATLAGIAAKAFKESQYHLRHSSGWTERLGDGTEESHTRMQDALNELWRFTDDLFAMRESDQELAKAGIAVDVSSLHDKWLKQVGDVLDRATLTIPAHSFMQKGSLHGRHTEHLGYLLAEMQSLHRAIPGVKW